MLDAARVLDGRKCARQKYAALIYTLTFTGCRIGEALALRWQDIDLLGGTISINHSVSRSGTLTAPKTRAGVRTVPIPDLLLTVLVEHKPLDAEDGSFVFPARHGGGPLSYWNVRERGWAETLKIAGLSDKGITVHDLRHCAASALISAGLSPVQVAGQLGHANARVTMSVYARAFDRSSADEKVRAAFATVAA